MIELWDGYVITADEYQYILGKPKPRANKKTGEIINAVVDATYHRTLAQALTTFHGMKLRECISGDVQTLLGAITASKQIEERIRKLVVETNFENVNTERKYENEL